MLVTPPLWLGSLFCGRGTQSLVDAHALPKADVVALLDEHPGTCLAVDLPHPGSWLRLDYQIVGERWNQGATYCLQQCEATWTGDDLALHADDLPGYDYAMIG